MFFGKKGLDLLMCIFSLIKDVGTPRCCCDRLDGWLFYYATNLSDN